MKIHTIGTGDAFGSGGRLNACTVVVAQDVTFCVDFGLSSHIALKKFGYECEQIDLVIVTHLHGDHFGGLPSLLLESYVRNRQRPLAIVGPEGTRERTLSALELFFYIKRDQIRFPLTFTEFQSGEKLTVDGVRIEPLPAVHVPETKPHSLRLFVDGYILAFSGDTEWNDALVRLTADADIFICEGSSLTPIRGHMSIDNLNAMRANIAAKNVYLNHVGEDVLQKRANLPFRVLNDGDVIFLPEAGDQSFRQ